MTPNRFSMLVVPGVGNSDAEHWQTLWEREDANARRIVVSDWDRPQCETWVEAIDSAVLTMGDSVVIVAHSLGCLAVAHWAARHPRRLHAAFLVAVPDPAGPPFPQAATGFLKTPLLTLPFRSLVVSSDNDPFGSPEYARSMAKAWGSTFATIGSAGHISAASGLGNWSQGQELLHALQIGIAVAGEP